MVEIAIKKVKIGTIKPNPDNPRSIKTKDMDRLIKSLNDFPEMLSLREIIVDENMMVLGGNMRLRALKKIGLKEVTAKIVTGLTPEQKREFIVKDNAGFGEWDMDLLATWDDLPLVEWGVDISSSWSEPVPPAAEPTEPEPEKPSIILCPKCGHEFSVLRKEDE